MGEIIGRSHGGIFADVIIPRILGAARTFGRRLKPALLPNAIYSRGNPDHQSAVDLFRGEWSSRLPLPGVTTGTSELYADPRVAWLAGHCGRLDGRSVLELGPLEGGHTFALENLGARVVAIESNQLAFQRCLIAKNALGMRATFLLGDFTRYLATTTERYDLVFASGVLYHMQDPVALLKDVSRVSNAVFIWTHYYDEAAIGKLPRIACSFTGRKSAAAVDGNARVEYHERAYRAGLLTYLLPGFCGGMNVKTNWMTVDDLDKCLASLGFDVREAQIEAGNPNGPCVSIYGRRSA